MEKESDISDKKEPSYAAKVWQTTGIVSLAIIVILILRVAFNILLMGLAGVLIAVYFHGLADLITVKIKIKRKPALFISIIGSIILLAVTSWFVGSKVQRQVAELSNTLPQTIKVARVKIANTPVGSKIIEYTSGNNSQKLLDTATTFFSTSFGIIGDLYIILFLGIFFTADPSLYKNGIIFFFPPQKKPTGRNILKKIDIALKGWLKSIIVSIVLITILVAVGLSMTGVPGTAGPGSYYRNAGNHSKFWAGDRHDTRRITCFYHQHKNGSGCCADIYSLSNHRRKHCRAFTAEKDD
ncbi:MAG: AI-2E family transporter [Puia sp.]